MTGDHQGAKRGPVAQALVEITGTVRAFMASSRALWGLYVPYFLEGIAYFGVLTLLMKYLSENVGLGDVKAGLVVSAFTGGITFAMFFLGELGDRYGLRRVLLLSIAIMACGRVFIACSRSSFDMASPVWYDTHAWRCCERKD